MNDVSRSPGALPVPPYSSSFQAPLRGIQCDPLDVALSPLPVTTLTHLLLSKTADFLSKKEEKQRQQHDLFYLFNKLSVRECFPQVLQQTNTVSLPTHQKPTHRQEPLASVSDTQGSVLIRHREIVTNSNGNPSTAILDTQSECSSRPFTSVLNQSWHSKKYSLYSHFFTFNGKNMISVTLLRQKCQRVLVKSAIGNSKKQGGFFVSFG